MVLAKKKLKNWTKKVEKNWTKKNRSFNVHKKKRLFNLVPFSFSFFLLPNSFTQNTNYVDDDDDDDDTVIYEKSDVLFVVSYNIVIIIINNIIHVDDRIIMDGWIFIFIQKNFLRLVLNGSYGFGNPFFFLLFWNTENILSSYKSLTFFFSCSHPESYIHWTLIIFFSFWHFSNEKNEFGITHALRIR